MLRVMRLPLASFKPEMRSGLEFLPVFLKSLPVTQEIKDLIAIPQIDGDFVNFFANLQGGVAPIPCQNATPQFSAAQSLLQLNYETRREALLNAIGNEASPAAEFLRLVLLNPQYMVAVDQTTPVIIPFLDSAQPIAGLAPAAPVAHARPAIFGTILCALLALALLGGSIFAYFAYLYPWPFDTEEKIAAAVSDVEQQKDLELLNHKLDSLLDKTDLRLEQAYAALGQKEAQGAINAAELLSTLQEQDRNNELAATKQAQLEAEAALEKLKKEQEEAARLEAERLAKEQEEAARLEAERLAKEQEEAARLEAERLAKEQEEAARLAKEQAAAAQVAKSNQTTQTIALPKCETIRQQGKMPVLLMAMDGSGSMLLNMKDGQIRMDSAIQAANTLIDRIDKNVNIHAFGIQGCPFAQNYGVFSLSERGTLKQILRRLDPRNAPNPGMLSTPFVSALVSINDAAPKDADSVGIIISDGLDTCYGAPNVNLCTLAEAIHVERPNLKINIIYMGDPADLRYIKCVSEITKGKIYSPNNTSQLIENIEQASQTLVQVCQ